MGTPVNIVVGSHVWTEDPEQAWIDGEVVQIKGNDATIVTPDGKTIVASLSSIYPKDTEAPAAGVDDMTKLSYLHEPGVLHNLACRFSLNEIYTYTGNILIAVNPFRRLPHLYDVHMMQQYKGATFGELSPHLFAVADDCYRAMINEHGSQSILVSGESGAGKTETTKMLMRYLAFMGGRSGTEGRTVEQQVLESNPVLEAFGNSKTVKNNNSSRFGKFVEIQFDKHGKISGAAVRTYLLERSRVCQVSDPERNYHCFYMLCSAPPEDVKRFKVENPKAFHYLNQTSCYEVANVDDAKEYLETRKAMDIVGISHDEQDAIFRVVAAILHLGNINFAKGKETDSSKLKDQKALYHLQTAAELLMCSEKDLEDSLCKRVIVTPDGNITKPLDPDSAASNRDALAKTVYSRLFDWIVDKINNSIGQDPTAKSIIGVLDIYGFESFKINSFEQLCINLTNEKLQQHFNQHVFKMEQEEYTKEEINWSYVEFVDNQDVLDLIEKKPGGIIALLDEACMFPKSTHETFAQKLYQTYKVHKRFSKPKLARTAFTINHYAGDVVYQADQFLDKNKDYVVAEHQALLNASKCSFVANLFPPLPEESSKQSKFSSIGTRFKQQLQSLMETLSTTEPHYIRCVKPNTVLKPGIFENHNVLNQLRCGGVLEAIRISCAGYPTKRTFDEFIDRFGMLAPDLIDSSDEKAACAALLDRMGLKGYQIGKTKVFLRAGQMAELDARRIEILANAAKRIQRQIRTYLTRREFIILRKATIRIQKLWRARLARKLYQHMKREDASIRIQKYTRAHTARKAYGELYASAIVIQTGLRAMAAHNEFRHRRRTKAAIIVQTQWRLYKARSSYKETQKATLILQCLWRGRIGRKELRKLKMDARDAGALREAKDKLEKRVEELTWRLDIEKHMRVDLEEAKGQEIAKLQSVVQEMQEQLEEAKDAIIKEKEAARIAIEQAPPVIMEVPVVDNTKLELLTNHNKELEDELSEFKIKAEEFEKKYYEVQKQTEDLIKETEESQSKICQLQEMMERLETNLSSLESENQVLRQQALEASKNEDLSEEIKSLESKIAELESENLLLRARPAVVIQQLVTAEAIQAPVVETLENGHQDREEPLISEEKIQIPQEKIVTPQENILIPLNSRVPAIPLATGDPIAPAASASAGHVTMPATDYQGSSAPFASIGRSILSIRRDQFHPSDHDGGSGLEVELESFQKQVADLFLDLGSGGADLLSLVWIQKLLDTFLICQEEFRVILFNGKSLISRPPLDRLISEFFERSVKALDVCNAIRDGIEQVRQWQRHLEIVLAALDARQHSFGEGQLRRAKKALTDLTILMLDEKEAGSAIAHRNRSFGRNSHSKDHHNRPGTHFRSLSWSVSRSWSANRQLQAIGNNLAAPRGNEISATSGLAVPVFTMNSVLLFVMWALVAAIPCQDRGLQTHFSIPRNFLWAAPVLSLHDQILDESKKRDRKNSCGLLREIHQMEKCSRHLMELTDTIQFPLPEEKEADVRQAVEELGGVCTSMKDGLDLLERQVREVFHRIVRSRTEGLDCLGKAHNPE